MFGGVKIIETEAVGDPYEDWSGVRSKGRAARRRAKYPQRIVTRYRANGKCVQDKVHNAIYIHPHDAIRLRQMIPTANPYANANPYSAYPW